MKAALRDGDWKVTVAIYFGRGRSDGRIVQVWPGFYEGHIYGVAIDAERDVLTGSWCPPVQPALLPRTRNERAQSRDGRLLDPCCRRGDGSVDRSHR